VVMMPIPFGKVFVLAAFFHCLRCAIQDTEADWEDGDRWSNEPSHLAESIPSPTRSVTKEGRHTRGIPFAGMCSHLLALFPLDARDSNSTIFEVQAGSHWFLDGKH